MIDVFDSLLDAPLDDVPEFEGDDSTVPGEEGAVFAAPAMLSAITISPLETYVVPYRGPMKLGARGKRVVALKRALGRCPVPGKNENYLPWFGKAFSPILGARTATAIINFRRDHGLEAKGLYDLATHKKLARYYDPYAIYLLSQTITPDQKKRNAFLAQLMYLYNLRYSIRYSQNRPFDTRRPPWALDCSSTGEWAAKYAGLPSLSGYSSFGYGNTHTQLSRFRALGRMRESISSAEIGDPKFYGSSSYNPTHTAYFIGRKDGQARVFSFGSYPAKLLDASYRHDGIAVCNLTGV